MIYVVDVDPDNFKSYDNFADVMDYHLNGRKHCLITYINFHPFITRYALCYGHTYKQISLEDIDKRYYLVCFGLNEQLLDKAREFKLKKGVITEEVW